MNKLHKKYLLTTVLALLCSCVSSENYVPAANKKDSLEPYNRAMTKFNRKADTYVIKPITKGYQKITTPTVRKHIASAFDNMHEPLYSVNHALQAEPKQSLKNIARFAINLTLGLGGLFDVASGWGLKGEKSNFDQTFAKWCIADGPYVVLPILGPSTVRGTAGSAADSFVNPVYWATYNDANIKDKVSVTYMAAEGIVKRDQVMALTDDLEENSVDYYASMRAMYLQNYEKINALCSRIKENAGNSYDFDFDDEEFFDD